METSNFLPENDQDLLLALRLNTALENKSRLESIEDDLIIKLLNFKYTEQQTIDALHSESSEMWNAISAKTRPSEPTKTHVLKLHSKKYNFRIWATAATVLIATFLGIFWFTMQQPTLVAQSDNTIKNVSLADGSHIILRPHSALYALSNTDSKRSYKLTGEAFFDVAKDETRPFSVEALNGTITVLGTRFNVSTWGNSTKVYLEEGSVQLQDEAKNTLVLKPGETATISDSNISSVHSTNGTEFKDWITNSIILNSTPLFEVVKELEHHFNIKITISEIENNAELITGTIPLESLDRTLNDLGVILGGTFRSIESNTFTFIPLN